MNDSRRCSTDRQSPRTGAAAANDYNYKETDCLQLTQLLQEQTARKEHKLLGLKCIMKCFKNSCLM